LPEKSAIIIGAGMAGLPPVALFGRNVAQIICRRDGRPFRTVKA